MEPHGFFCNVFYSPRSIFCFIQAFSLVFHADRWSPLWAGAPASALLCYKMHPICLLSLLYPVSVQQLKITSRVLQHATSSFLQSWISIKYLPGLPISSCYSLEKNVFAPNWFPSSLPIYINPLIAKAGKTYSSDSCSCWPIGKKNGSANCDVWNQDFFIAIRRGVSVCPFYRDIVS